MKTFTVSDIAEKIIERTDFPMEKVRDILKDQTIAVIGYGVQGQAQSLNMRDNGLNVIIGVRSQGRSWALAEEEGWIPGKTLFSIEEAVGRGTTIEYLLSDAGQMLCWDNVRKGLSENDCLYFSHGFSTTFAKQTDVVPPSNIDVVMVAPKGAGATVRSHFLEGRGINASYGIYQDYTGRARERCLALGFAIGSAYLFETSLEKEVYSDLVGERGTLLGGIYGLWLAQYEILREHGHSPSEAFNETVEEATQSLYPLTAEKGVDWMIANCSTTAQRGALDWYRKFADAVRPVFKELYDKVISGEEAKNVIEANSRPDYREQLDRELREIADSEMWEIGRITRSLRPERQAPSE